MSLCDIMSLLFALFGDTNSMGGCGSTAGAIIALIGHELFWETPKPEQRIDGGALMANEPKLKPSDVRRFRREAERLIAAGEMPSLAELLSAVAEVGESTPTNHSLSKNRRRTKEQ